MGYIIEVTDLAFPERYCGPRLRFMVGWNAPGCLPEVDPYEIEVFPFDRSARLLLAHLRDTVYSWPECDADSYYGARWLDVVDDIRAGITVTRGPAADAYYYDLPNGQVLFAERVTGGGS